MNRYPYLLNRNGYYYFRMAVPSSLTACIGKSELTYSLRTKEAGEARVRCLVMLEATQTLLSELLSGQEVEEKTLREHLKCYHSGYFKNKPRINLKLNTPVQNTDTVPPNRKEGESLISQVYELYLSECTDREKTILTKRAMLKLWLEIVGNTPVMAIGKADARDFKQVLMKLPSNLNKRFKGKSVKDIDLESIPADQRLSVKSVNINLGYMNAFVNWMIRNSYYESANPFSGMQLKDKERGQDKRNSFSADELKAIFTSPVYAGCKNDTQRGRYEDGTTIIKDGFYWVPLIALYSGARMQEICQLYVTDIKKMGDIWIFDFNDDGDDKQLKTVSSKRKTPIHPKLIELGLIEHLETKIKEGELRLFPDLPMGSNGTYSGVFSKRFNHFLKRFKIKSDKTSFHSFRHTFIDTLRNTDVHREVREALVGHLDKRTAHDNYGSAIGIQRLYEGIIKLNYDLN